MPLSIIITAAINVNLGSIATSSLAQDLFLSHKRQGGVKFFHYKIGVGIFSSAPWLVKNVKFTSGWRLCCQKPRLVKVPIAGPRLHVHWFISITASMIDIRNAGPYLDAMIGGSEGVHIHIFTFTSGKNNRLQKKSVGRTWIYEICTPDCNNADHWCTATVYACHLEHEDGGEWL